MTFFLNRVIIFYMGDYITKNNRVSRKYTEPTLPDLSMSSLIQSGNLPVSHKKCADNYNIIKKVFGFSAVNSTISNYEKAFLKRHDFNVLEYTTGQKMALELEKLKKWSLDDDKYTQSIGDTIIQIRLKELKFLCASNYASVSSEIYDGYKVLDRYFESITKY